MMVSAIASNIPRAHERKRVLWDVMLNQNGRIWKCRAFDISPGGIKIRIAEPLAINSKVIVAIDRAGNFAGEIRWQDKGLAGIAFLEDAAVVKERLRCRSLSDDEVSAA
jgi:PilZ domain